MSGRVFPWFLSHVELFLQLLVLKHILFVQVLECFAVGVFYTGRLLLYMFDVPWVPGVMFWIRCLDFEKTISMTNLNPESSNLSDSG